MSWRCGTPAHLHHIFKDSLHLSPFRSTIGTTNTIIHSVPIPSLVFKVNGKFFKKRNKTEKLDVVVMTVLGMHLVIFQNHSFGKK
jgi:hypothetical protein